MIMYDENVDEISNVDLFAEVFEDLWDMFWHHHWGIQNYLEPLTIIFFDTDKIGLKRCRLIVVSFPLFKQIRSPIWS